MSEGSESVPTPHQTTAGEAAQAADHAALARREEADRKRKIQALEMQRERILSERTSSPHRRNALELALADVERVLQELGWALKL